MVIFKHLRHLKKPDHIHQSPQPIISINDFQTGWAKAKEKTSSHGNAIHFGHMKACAEDTHLAAFEATMCHIPYATGYTPLA